MRFMSSPPDRVAIPIEDPGRCRFLPTIRDARCTVGSSRCRGAALDPQTLGDHLDRLFRAAWALCGSREDAEDLVQETYERVLRRPRFVRREDDLGYLYRALHHTYFNARRTASRRPQVGAQLDDVQTASSRADVQPEQAAEINLVLEAVAALPAADARGARRGGRASG